MKNILKRLFINLPLYILFFVSIFTVIIPVGYWIITGEDYTDFFDRIEEI